jgi:hypothetical protein
VRPILNPGLSLPRGGIEVFRSVLGVFDEAICSNLIVRVQPLPHVWPVPAAPLLTKRWKTPAVYLPLDQRAEAIAAEPRRDTPVQLVPADIEAGRFVAAISLISTRLDHLHRHVATL